MNNQVKIFTYGTIKDPQILGRIVGTEQIEGQQAVLENYVLTTQRLDQVSDSVSPEAPVFISPQQLLRESWDDGFKSYGIQKQEGKQTEGIVYSVDKQGLELLEDWELVPFGWFRTEEVEVLNQTGERETVLVFVLGDNQETEMEYEGNKYPLFPGNVTKEKYLEVVEKARREFFERESRMQGEVTSGFLGNNAKK